MGFVEFFKYAEVKALTTFVWTICVFLFVGFSYSWLLVGVALIPVALLLRRIAAGGRCDHVRDLRGKVTVVTGANTGLGKCTAERLAALGSHVILACRSVEKAEQAVADIKKATGNENVEAMKLDLSSFKSVRQFAEEFQRRKLNCDILVNNAGVMMCPWSKTEDGFEVQFGTNHLGHFLLVKLLLPVLLKCKARVVNVSSLGHIFAKPYTNFEEMAHPSEASYDKTISYGYSKMANILLTTELQRRYGDQGLTSYAVHPGSVQTELARFFPSFVQAAFHSRFSSLLVKEATEGAQTSVYCAIDPSAKAGAYFTDCQTVACSAEASDSKRAADLWEWSEKAVAGAQ